MDLKKFLISGILAGIAIFIVSFIFDYLVGMFFPYDSFTLGGMRAMEDPMMMFFFLNPWVLGFSMSAVYHYVKDSFKGTTMQKGKSFGLLVWLVAGLPSAFIVYTSMNYPVRFTISSIFGSLLYMVAGAIVIAKFME
ncbi:MAG: hypothetical protein V1672_04670 [Candidatus Diapherotrites archaeon]